MRTAVLGAGSWGTTLALLLDSKGESVSLWDGQREHLESIRKFGENKRYLPGIKVPEKIKISHYLEDILSGSDFMVVALPSQAVREVCRKISVITKQKDVISVSKGLEDGTLKRLSLVINEELPESRICVLSGPSHAEEVSRKMPAAVVSSSEDMNFARAVQKLFSTEYFRVYTNSDLAGVEIAGALKNIIAIACGISDGLGFGDNTKSALITRGLVEISRLGVAMGAKLGTFSGLAGMGDLFTTCSSRHSRNKRFGELLAAGKSQEEALEEIGQVVEGIKTCSSAYKLSKVYDIEAPITVQVYEVIFAGKDPREAALDLMLRMPRGEQEDKFLGRRK
jgi:glycerol-3-phosphate dehydrogenase (NAD(P)+)